MTRATVLIVDDESAGREAMAAMLAGEDYALAFAASGSEALTRAADVTPDVILLDVMMPGMDGFEVCRRLRADAHLAEVPVIITTVLDDRASRLEGLKAGADDFISKPLDRIELRTRLRALTRLNRFRRLLQERTRLGWVLDGADEGYVILDGDDAVSYANAAARRLLDLPAAGGPGAASFRACVAARFACRPASAWAAWPALPDAGLTLIAPPPPATPTLWVRVDALESPAGELHQRVVRLRDVTAQTALEARVRERTAELEAANRELESFASAVAHDLRAPLRAIDSFGRALQEDCAASLNAEGRQFLDRILVNTERMGELIADLLRLARVARAELRREPVDLSAMAAAVIEALRQQEPGRAVEVAIAPALTAVADSGLTRVLLDNLIGNAWKFTRHKAGARIELRAAPDEGGGFVIADNGAGFDMAAAERLFRPFLRLHRAQDFEGTGIGLATARRIVHRHGGRIRAEAAVDQGARFFFTLEPASDWTPPAAEHREDGDAA